MTEFIIVGRGLAAAVIAHSLHSQSKTFTIIGNENLSACSKIAAGIWNPIVFKRMTKSWLADELILCLNDFYTHCEQILNTELITQRELIKPFTEEQEKKLWLKKAGFELSDFLDDLIQDPVSPAFGHCLIPNQFGKVKQSGNLNMAEFLNATSTFFKNSLIDETFNYSDLVIKDDCVSYKNISAKNIIFCEGYLVKNNPFFSWIPLKPAKGEVLTINAPALKLKNQILNKNGFLMDLQDCTFKVGATYEWQDLSEDATQKGELELKDKLAHLINCDYTIVSHQAGVRPSSSDRRPIIGQHPAHKNAFVFNGLGTKGVMLAPYFAKKFVNFYLQKETLPKEVDVNRFYSLYADKKK